MASLERLRSICSFFFLRRLSGCDGGVRTFCFYLNSESADRASIQETERKGYRVMTKILLAEDSKFLRLSVERARARAGYDMSSAADGEEGLLMAREKLPDLILLDMLLPKISGPDVLIALKKDPLTNAIPVVVITGLSLKNAARLQGDGAVAFLEKSELKLDKGPEKLLEAVQEILKNLPELSRTTAASTASGG
jgi:CheY-like chemotaxis protein